MTRSYLLPVTILVLLVTGAILTKAGIPPTRGAGGPVQGQMGKRQVSPSLKTGGTGTTQALQEEIGGVIAGVLPAMTSVIRHSAGNPTAAPGSTELLVPFTSGNVSIGSGVLFDSRGYLVTTCNTVGKDLNVDVITYHAGRQRHAATVVSKDDRRNIAVLKISGTGVFPSVRLGDSDLLKTGDLVFALGSPYGFSRSVTMGIVSKDHRQITAGRTTFPHMIQTDAAINSGNEGGALVNIRGEVVGINMAGYMPARRFTGIGFAMPINGILQFLRSLHL